MKKVLFYAAIICLFGIQAQSQETLAPEYQEKIKPFVEAVIRGDKSAIADFINFPLRRGYPIAWISDKEEMLYRFNQVFDAALLKEIKESSIATDYSAVGWRGIAFKNGMIWFSDEGKLFSINYQSEAEKNIKAALIRREKSLLHVSLRDFREPCMIAETAKCRIRIDDLGDQKYRYASWPISKKQLDKPDLIIPDGKIIFEGTGGNHYYEFKDGDYQYVIRINLIGPDDMPPDTLKIYYREHELLQTQDILSKRD